MKRPDAGDGALPFFDRDAQRELGLCIERAREAEDNRHVRETGEITHDFTNRGLTASTVYFGAIANAKVQHLRELSKTAREELFKLARAKNVRLKAADVAAITAFVATPFGQSGERLARELMGGMRARGLRVNSDLGLGKQLQAAQHQETVVEVEIAASELCREQKAKRKKWWFERLEKAIWIVVGLVFGILGTLVTQALLSK